MTALRGWIVFEATPRQMVSGQLFKADSARNSVDTSIKLGQRLALVVYEDVEDAKQVWIEWHQAGMVGHQQ